MSRAKMDDLISYSSKTFKTQPFPSSKPLWKMCCILPGCTSSFSSPPMFIGRSQTDFKRSIPTPTVPKFIDVALIKSMRTIWLTRISDTEKYNKI